MAKQDVYLQCCEEYRDHAVAVSDRFDSFMRAAQWASDHARISSVPVSVCAYSIDKEGVSTNLVEILRFKPIRKSEEATKPAG